MYAIVDLEKLKERIALYQREGDVVTVMVLKEIRDELCEPFWTDVTDELPTEGQAVLFRIKWEDLPVAGWFHKGDFTAAPEAYSVSCGMWCYGGTVADGFDQDEVTHWAPVPPANTGETNEA